MKYLRRFKNKSEAVGQTMPIPSVLSIEETQDRVGYLNTDIGLKETNIVNTADESFVEGEYEWCITVTYNVTTSSSTTQILYKIGNVTKMFYGGGGFQPLHHMYFLKLASNLSLLPSVIKNA